MFSTSVEFCYDSSKSYNVFSMLLWLESLEAAIIFVASKAVNILKIHIPMKSHTDCKKKKNGFFSELHICLSLTKKGHQSLRGLFAVSKM